ncbi:MAG TPA: hypothetical protein VIZ58_02900 [Thermoanaerobaculia bacterium]
MSTNEKSRPNKKEALPDDRREAERRRKSRRAHRRLRISIPESDRRETERRESPN